MEDNIKFSGLGPILKKLAPKVGAKIIVEPKWGLVGQISFSNGVKRYFRYSSLDLNPLGASAISKDKDYANFFMSKMGYPIISGKAFCSPIWAKTIGQKQKDQEAYQYAKEIGFPLIAKPNSGSQGNGVFLANNKIELKRALKYIFDRDNIALIQKFISGNDYRIVVLDNKIISAYQRIPFCIIGNSKDTIDKLIKNKLKNLASLNRPVNVKVDDLRVIQNLKRQKLNLKSVLKKDKKIYLLNNANLSSGGEAIEVTKKIHPDFKKLAIKLTKDMGLRLCGVDLIVQGEISLPAKKYQVIEINAAPGLDHYIKLGRAQEKIVERMYLEVLKAMKRA